LIGHNLVTVFFEFSYLEWASYISYLVCLKLIRTMLTYYTEWQSFGGTSHSRQLHTSLWKLTLFSVWSSSYWDVTINQPHVQALTTICRARKAARQSFILLLRQNQKQFKQRKEFSNRNRQVIWTWLRKSALIYSNFWGIT